MRCMRERAWVVCKAPWSTGSQQWCNALASKLWNLASSLLCFLHAARVNYPTTSSTQHILFNSLDNNRAEFNHTRHHEHPVLNKKEKHTWNKINKTFQPSDSDLKHQGKAGVSIIPPSGCALPLKRPHLQGKIWTTKNLSDRFFSPKERKQRAQSKIRVPQGPQQSFGSLTIYTRDSPPCCSGPPQNQLAFISPCSGHAFSEGRDNPATSASSYCRVSSSHRQMCCDAFT